jgi:hypothetical protein
MGILAASCVGRLAGEPLGLATEDEVAVGNQDLFAGHCRPVEHFA